VESSLITAGVLALSAFEAYVLWDWWSPYLQRLLTYLIVRATAWKYGAVLKQNPPIREHRTHFQLWWNNTKDGWSVYVRSTESRSNYTHPPYIVFIRKWASKLVRLFTDNKRGRGTMDERDENLAVDDRTTDALICAIAKQVLDRLFPQGPRS
jgi:hypothetical protein